MAGYSPLKITGMTTGLVQEREEFLLPDDAYPKLKNAYVWRERIKRKKGCLLLGRLQRNIGTTDGAGNFVVVITPLPIQPGIASFTVGSNLFNDPGGASPVVLNTSGPGTATLDRATGTLTIVGSNALTAVQYFPGLPVMGIRSREQQNDLNDQTVFFDQNYAYIFNATTNSFQEFIPGTTWNAAAEGLGGTSFFWSTNYWVSQLLIPGTANPLFTTTNRKLFWETNNTGQFGANQDPPRITDGITWVAFYNNTLPLVNSPWAQIGFDSIPNPVFLTNFLSMLPFRGRMVVFNTWEGTSAGSAQQFSNRIRWSTIGNPFIPYVNGPPARGSWRDDIRGQGGFLDIPTSEDIVSVGFVRDNLVIYCEHSTWQLRYTGRSIAPFQIERVNSELGGEGPFSAIQFDTSLVGIGDKGVVECDSYKSERIDIKILDFVFEIQSVNGGPKRVHGVRDFINRLAFWTVPLSSEYDPVVPEANRLFPNIRLIYNYENDSWATFNDTFTALGTFQPTTSRTWLNTKLPWIRANFSWIGTQASGQPDIVGGNQQGYVEYLDSETVNDVTLFISNVQGNTTLPTVITSPNHNLQTGSVIGIQDIPTATPYANLNGGVYGIIVGDNSNADPANKFRLMKYNTATGQFSTPQLDVPSGPYVGGGQINVRDNFHIISKKFNFLDEGQNIQLGYVDILMDATELDEPGAISLFMYVDYNENQTSNTLPNNRIANSGPAGIPDTFFNSIIPTTPSTLNSIGGTKFWQRVICPTRASFLTLEYTFSNAQMAGGEQTKDVQIDAQILWIRKAGRISQI